MIKYISYNRLILLLLIFLSSTMLFAQIPAGGISLIPDSGTNYQKIGKGTLSAITILLLLSIGSFAQNKKDRIKFNNQEIFLNGANIAWINFANDIGPISKTNMEGFRKILDKPLSITEFHPKTTFVADESLLYDELYKRGYASAQA